MSLETHCTFVADGYYFTINPPSCFTEIVRDVKVLSGSEATLPCTLAPYDKHQDRHKLILWFLNGSETPFYM